MASIGATGNLQMDEAQRDFSARYPDYASTAALDRLRSTEYRRLDERGHVYLDYTGGSLYTESQLQRHFELLRANVFGNPHSANPTSEATTRHVERTRGYVLRYFNARPEDYILAFTLNASAALKLVGESFPFAPGGRFLLAFDNHNSVNGIREFARAKGAVVDYAPLSAPELRLDRDALDELLDSADPDRYNLFAYPAQSNFSGVKHPLDLVAAAQAKAWDVLLDAAAFVPANRLDLSAVQPEFVCVSFYKMFGYPTGVGALLIRRAAFAKLKRPWFAGGTVDFASVHAQAHVLSGNEAAFEDGTLNYLSIPAVEIGLQHLESIGIDAIARRMRCLTGWLLEELLALRHGNGRAIVRVYGPQDTRDRGGTVTFNLYDPQGNCLEHRRIEELAGKENISLRTGCFCNPGPGEIAAGLTEEDVRAGFALGPEMNMVNFARLMQDRGHNGIGAIRASLGLASNFGDVWRLRRFIAAFRDKTRVAIGEANYGEANYDAASGAVIRDGS